MAKLLSATKYAIEHRDEDTVQLFQVNKRANSSKLLFIENDCRVM